MIPQPCVSAVQVTGKKTVKVITGSECLYYSLLGILSRRSAWASAAPDLAPDPFIGHTWHTLIIIMIIHYIYIALFKALKDALYSEG